MTSSIARKVVPSFQAIPGAPASDSAQLAPREQQILDLIVRGYMRPPLGSRA